MYILNENKRMVKHGNTLNVNDFLSEHDIFHIHKIWVQWSCAMQFHHNFIMVWKNSYKAIGGKNDRQVFSYDKKDM